MYTKIASFVPLEKKQHTGTFAIDRLLKLQAVTYNFKTASTENRRTGYKAQEVQKIAPDFVRENEDGFLQVYYDAFIPWITESIKTIYKRVVAVEAQQVKQNREIASVKAQKADKAEVDAKVQKLEAEHIAKDLKIKELEAKSKKAEQENAAIKAYLCAKDPAAVICK